MQKKKGFQLAAAAVLAVLAAALLIVFLRTKPANVPASSAAESSGPESAAQSEAPASSTAASRAELPASESSAGHESESESQQEEEPASSEPEGAVSSEEAGSSSASPESASSAVSSSKAASSAASSSHAVSSSHAASSGSHAASSASSAASQTHVEIQIRKYIMDLERLQRSTEAKLYSVICEAYDEYMAHPKEERNMGLKISIVVSKTLKLTNVQSECDKEFNQQLSELRQYLRDNGQEQTVADDAEKEYKRLKSELTKEFTNIVYSSAVGSGDGGRWIKEHARYKAGENS